ncbi:unnamed protein product [Phytophthora fragariaefolia]|uniref:Unnamed protein product n=1 Tax=Phytophthora fragariaefolia TaxID=1490495 RepID=A0A9W7CY07_9STRA|nr:unnamed protein product [Phytophthora fragariaefolia]
MMHRLTSKLFRDLNNTKSFYDDIYVFTKPPNIEDHLDALRKTLDILRDNKLYVKRLMHLCTNASKFAVGGSLFIVVDGFERQIAYTRLKIKSTEFNYPTQQQELVYIGRFSDLLSGQTTHYRNQSQESRRIFHPEDVQSLTGTLRDVDPIWVVVDQLTKRCNFLPITKKVNAEGVARRFVDNIWKSHDRPTNIVSDLDMKFASTFWQHVFKSIGMKLSMTVKLLNKSFDDRAYLSTQNLDPKYSGLPKSTMFWTKRIGPYTVVRKIHNHA